MATPRLMIVGGNGSEPKGVCEACGARFPQDPNSNSTPNRILAIYVDFAVHRCLEQVSESRAHAGAGGRV